MHQQNYSHGLVEDTLHIIWCVMRVMTFFFSVLNSFGAKKGKGNNTTRDTGKWYKRSSLNQLKSGCWKLSMRIQTHPVWVTVILTATEGMGYMRKTSVLTSYGANGTAVEYLQHTNVGKLLTWQKMEDKGRWGQPRKGWDQARLVVGSYQF